MRRNKTFVAGIFCLVLLLSTPFGLSAGETETPYIFTNDDLGQYGSSSEEPLPDPPDENVQAGTSSSKASDFPDQRTMTRKKPKSDKAYARRVEEHNKRSWCNRGKVRRKEVERAESDFKAAKEYYDRIEEDFSVVRISSCKLNGAKNRLEAAKNRLKRAKKELSDLENEAHSQWVPPGWVRCQFDY